MCHENGFCVIKKKGRKAMGKKRVILLAIRYEKKMGTKISWVDRFFLFFIGGSYLGKKKKESDGH
jgi:hypothetical protein